MKNAVFIIDFDSTFVTLEALDTLAEITLAKNPQKKQILNQIQNITKEGMEGNIPFDTSLAQRLQLFSANKKHIQKLITLLKKSITPSIAKNKAFFKKNAENIYIISGGFQEYIYPVVKPFGIAKSHVLANTFVFDTEGRITGFDTKNLLAQKQGKVKQVQALASKQPIHVIGDGFTDYQIKQHGLAHTFFAFTENITRKQVVKNADKVVKSFDEILYNLHLPRSMSYPKSLMNVLLLENIANEAMTYFEKQGYHVEKLLQALGEDELCEKIKDVSLLGIRSKTEITPKVIAHAEKLLAIGTFCIGTNQVALKTCSEHGIAVFNAPYSNTRSVVELALGTIIMLQRRTFEKSINMHKGIWDKSAKNSHEIRGRKLGIVGYGNIGSQLSVLAENLGMEVYFYDTADKLSLGNAKKCNSLYELLETVDIVTIHVDGQKENTNLIDRDAFSHMKDGVLFINMSRGFIVDVSALSENLKSGKVGGAAVDVFPQEPKSNIDPFVSPLQQLSNVILTPHVAGSTIEAQRNIASFVSEKLTQFVDRGSTTLSINFPQLQLPMLHNAHRFIHIHQNVPGVMAKINTVFSKNHLNITGQYLKTNETIGYVITDVEKKYSREIIKQLQRIPETIKMRILY